MDKHMTTMVLLQGFIATQIYTHRFPQRHRIFMVSKFFVMNSHSYAHIKHIVTHQAVGIFAWIASYFGEFLLKKKKKKYDDGFSISNCFAKCLSTNDEQCKPLSRTMNKLLTEQCQHSLFW